VKEGCDKGKKTTGGKPFRIKELEKDRSGEDSDDQKSNRGEHIRAPPLNLKKEGGSRARAL